MPVYTASTRKYPSAVVQIVNPHFVGFWYNAVWSDTFVWNIPLNYQRSDSSMASKIETMWKNTTSFLFAVSEVLLLDSFISISLEISASLKNNFILVELFMFLTHFRLCIHILLLKQFPHLDIFVPIEVWLSLNNLFSSWKDIFANGIFFHE